MDVGPVAIAPGGCVANTGLALRRLGIRPRMMGKVGDDPFGGILRNALAEVDRSLAEGLLVVEGEHTSYSVILSPSGMDRMALHFPGANDTFTSEDIPEADLEGARLFHFGYPPIMRRMFEDGGENLARLLERAKSPGLTTSLDMAYPDPSAESGRADWRRILQVTLPHVDVFLPSLEEVLLMLEPESSWEIVEGGSDALLEVPVERISRVAEEVIAMGAGVAGIKVGERGLYLRTGSVERLAGAGSAFPSALGEWANRELWTSVFEVDAIGTTGAGDATVAGFLLALLRGMAPEETITAACAVGAFSVEAADATSSIQDWECVRARLARGWRRRDTPLDRAWRETGQQGIWAGPRDSRGAHDPLPGGKP